MVDDVASGLSLLAGGVTGTLVDQVFDFTSVGKYHLGDDAHLECPGGNQVASES